MKRSEKENSMDRYFKNVCARMLVASMFAAGTLAISPTVASAKNHASKCADCGTVLTTNRKDQKGSGTTGAVVGGVGGAVAGKTLGDSNTAAVLGGVGGALAGNMVGKKMTTKKIWSVEVRLDNGGIRNIDYDTDPEFKRGDRVRLVNGQLERL
jgi:outer membrane lipoprotein SlyB